MADYDYAFVTQFEEMKADIQELLWEESQGSVDRMTEFYRFTDKWFENIDDDGFWAIERNWLIWREARRLIESGTWSA